MATTMTKLSLVAILAVIVAMSYTSEAAISCGVVSQNMLPCLNYLRNIGPLTPGCCGGVNALNKAAQTTPDRKAACACLKQAAAAITGISPGNAASLPGKCGVSIPYKISTSTNCASVK